MRVEILEADLDDADHAKAIIDLVDEYAQTPAGRSAGLEESEKARLIAGLRAYPQTFTLIAVAAETIVGVAVCHEGFSTFRAKPYINVHDLAVTRGYQSRGIGTKLLRAVVDEATRRNACKVTLEVHRSNTRASRLYRRLGFGPWDRPTLFLTKAL